MRLAPSRAGGPGPCIHRPAVVDGVAAVVVCSSFMCLASRHTRSFPLHLGFSYMVSGPEIADFGVLGGPGGPENHARRWVAKLPTFRNGFRGRRGCPDPQHRRSPAGPKTMPQKSKWIRPFPLRAVPLWVFLAPHKVLAHGRRARRQPPIARVPRRGR